MRKALNEQFLLGALALSCATLFIACQSTPKRTHAELRRLQGDWEGFQQGATNKLSIKITGNSLHFYGGTNFWFNTTFTLPAGTEPQQLRATINEAPPSDTNSIGQVVVAIFKIEDETLILAVKGEEPPDAFPSGLDTNSPIARYDFKKVQP